MDLNQLSICYNSFVVNIVFESHSTSMDNENHLSSGWNDVELSPLGIQQAKDLGERRKDEKFDAIFCSDLQRSYKTAEIAFGNKFPIIRDKRLRECNYGDLTQSPSEQASERMKSFLKDLAKNYSGKKVMIIGHRATQYGLEHWIKGISFQEVVPTLWKWQPGWVYKFESII